MSRHHYWILPAVLLISACSQQREKASTSVAPSTSASTALSESQTLCLTDAANEEHAEKSLMQAQGAAGKHPGRAENWVTVGRGWVREARLRTDPGYYVNVDACAAAALAIDQKFLPALELRGLVMMNNHQFESARVLAEEILALAPDSIIAHGTLSDALLELGRYPQAAQATQAMMDIHPGMAASARAAHLNWLNGDTRSAALFIRDALQGRSSADPEAAAWTFVEAGTLYWQQGDYPGADALFSEALKWRPDYPSALVGRARVSLATGKADAAVSYLVKAETQQPTVETSWLLGDAYTLLDDTEHAQQAYDAAIQLGRRGDRLTLAAFLSSKNRDPAEALRLIEQERQERGGIYLDDVHAWSLYRAGRIDDAHHASAPVLRLGTRDARLLFHVGAIEFAAGDRQRGREKIALALSINPGFDPIESAEARALLATDSTLHAKD